jgi:quinol monooxygenase YgiN
MLVRIVHLEIQPEFTSRFLQLFSVHQQAISQFEGCLSLQLLQDEKDPNHVATLSHWRSSADLDHYRYSEFFKSLWSQVKPLFSAPARATSFQIWKS